MSVSKYIGVCRCLYLKIFNVICTPKVGLIIQHIEVQISELKRGGEMKKITSQSHNKVHTLLHLVISSDVELQRILIKFPSVLTPLDRRVI